MMKKKKTLFESLAERASVLRVPSSISIPIIRHFVYLSVNSGMEWTISRFKSIKVDFIRSRAGQPLITPWVSKKNNYFKGPLGGLQRWAMKNDRNFDAAIQLLQIYSFFISDTVTSAQAEKFVTAVQYSVEYHPYFNAYSDILLHATKRVFPDQSWYPDPGSLVFRPVSKGKREPHASGRSFPEGQSTLQCAQSFINGTSIGRELVEKYPHLFGCVLSGVASATDLRQHFVLGDYRNIVGKIGLIQEPGYKLRAVANPARVYQEVLKPLGDDLYRKLRSLPWDCTHDQTFPFSIIQDHLEKRRTAFAVDLSNATDLFPFELQYRTLHQMYVRKDQIELFSALSRASWATDLTQDREIKWTVGQPLGLYPSFASFALTHGLMLYGLNNFRHDNAFFVLGDDVVILDAGLHDKYLRFLCNVGVAYSPSKTISSDVLTEFGGKIITSNRVIPQLKWRRVSDDSFMDLSRVIGERIRSILLPRQRRVFDIVKVIPDFLGGCGFNPDGLPLEDRIKLYYQSIKTESLLSYMLSYNGRQNEINYAPLSPCGDGKHRTMLLATLPSGSWFLAESQSDTFDQKVLSLLAEIPNLPRFFAAGPWNSFGTFYFNAFPRERYMQIAGQGYCHTTLEVLERKFF